MREHSLKPFSPPQWNPNVGSNKSNTDVLYLQKSTSRSAYRSTATKVQDTCLLPADSGLTPPVPSRSAREPERDMREPAIPTEYIKINPSSHMQRYIIMPRLCIFACPPPLCLSVLVLALALRLSLSCLLPPCLPACLLLLA